MQAWEGRAYDYCMDNLRNMGFPVEGLAFDPNLVCVSLEYNCGNVLFVKSESALLALTGHSRPSNRQREWKFG